MLGWTPVYWLFLGLYCLPWAPSQPDCVNSERHVSETLEVGFVNARILRGERSIGNPWHRASDSLIRAGGLGSRAGLAS